MAISFKKLSKGLGLSSFFTVGKYKDCRVDSIAEQDPKYILVTKDKFGWVYLPEVLATIEKQNRAIETQRARRAKVLDKFGIAALFDNWEALEEQMSQDDILPELEDIPF